MTPETRALCERVIALDAEATKGPWEVDALGINGRIHAIGPIAGYDYNSLELHGGDVIDEANAALVSEYRIAAPALAQACLASEAAREEAAVLYQKIANILEDDGCNCEDGGDPEAGDSSASKYRCANHRIEDALCEYRERVCAHLATKPTQAKDGAVQYFAEPLEGRIHKDLPGGRAAWAAKAPRKEEDGRGR